MKFGQNLALRVAALGASGLLLAAPATAPGEQAPALPAPPPHGVMGFVIEDFHAPVLQEPAACPDGPTPKLRDAYLDAQPPEERARLRLKENEPELTRKWQAMIFGPNGANLCSQPELFDRPLLRTVQSKRAIGLDLDEGASGETCTHDEFSSPGGDSGIDNQEYRVMGCTLEWRGIDGVDGDQAIGMRQFHASGQWTQVILLRGIDSLDDDPEVEVIYANTPDRPMTDSKGRFLPGASFTVSDVPPRYRNVLKGQIRHGVLTTAPQDITLTQTWGQGGARDIRGNRTKYDFRRGRLRLTFQPDGSVTGLLGGYRPIFDVIQSPAIGGVGAASVAGIDCAAVLATLRRYADGVRDPKSGQCTAVSSAQSIRAVAAHVNDIPARASQ